eukprot:NODE_172_length_15988_cov_0.603940.p10 type:complete len:115 gc:universal NODE_172_length_15988_cov_0.603940:3422-3078(-)
MSPFVMKSIVATRTASVESLAADIHVMSNTELSLEIERYINWDKLQLLENKVKLLRHIEKWRDGEQYHAFIIVSLQQRNLCDVVSFFHENGRNNNPEISNVYDQLVDQLILLSK